MASLERSHCAAITLRPLVLLACATAAALALAGAAGATTDSYDGVAFYPFTMDAANQACVPGDEPGLGPTRNCDPINVIFPGQSLPAVVDRLHRAGWTDTAATPQWLHFGSSVLVSTQAQLEVRDGPDPTQRFHVRLWQAAPGLTIGNVHHEHGSPHRIDLAWDEAEAFLASGLCSSWCGHVYLEAQAAIQDGMPDWRGFGNDAWATVVPLSPAPSVELAAAPKASTAAPAPKSRHHKAHRKRRPRRASV